MSTPLRLTLNSWESAVKAVESWLVCKASPASSANELARAREHAARAVSDAMLRDAVGMVVKYVDNQSPNGWQRNPRPFAQEVVNSIFGGKRFTSIIASHDPGGDASLRTWLTRRIYWKIFDHLRIEQRKQLREITRPDGSGDNALLTEEEFIWLERGAGEEFCVPSAEEQASENEMINAGWERFHAVLTEREQQVMHCYLNGMENEEGCRHLAQKFELSLATYKRDKKQALDKLRIFKQNT